MKGYHLNARATEETLSDGFCRTGACRSTPVWSSTDWLLRSGEAARSRPYMCPNFCKCVCCSVFRLAC